MDLWTTVRITPIAGMLHVALEDILAHAGVPLATLESKFKGAGRPATPLSFTLGEQASASFRVVWEALLDVLGTEDLSLWALKIEVKSSIPMGKGLGSSGAFSTALAAALLQHKDHSVAPSKEAIKEQALRGESLFHGKTSGIDVEVSVFGGTRAFNGGTSKAIANPSDCYHVMLVDTDVPRNAKEMISKAKDGMAAMDPGKREAELARLESYIQRIVEGDCRGFRGYFSEFQAFLRVIGVSHPAIDGFESVLLDGKWGVEAKITGAGGGGYLVALFPKNWFMRWLRKFQIRRALSADPRTQPYTYTMTSVQNTSLGVKVRLLQQ